ncbi:hypothetical protein L1049_005810 [Liquidambar formosana]|uniref:Uncharacterized protein n=1 Tax=Liquidambar formosana TaxID=63359 RepID=A0AAP0WQF9_LIQFO
MEVYVNKKRVRDESDDSEFDLPEVKKLRDDLLDILDDSDADPTTQDLASVMKSFEEEILTASPSPPAIVDLTSDSGESQPELGYLLEASDDELGLPPSTTSSGVEGNKEVTELVRVSTESTGLSELWGLDDGIACYDSVDFGVGENYYNNGEYVALEGLFDYSDVGYGPSDFSDFSWRPGTLPAI